MIDISVYLFGGLGNRLFQMASCFGIARKRGGTPRIAGYHPGSSRSPTVYVRLMRRFDPDTELRAVTFKDLGNLTVDDGIFREKLAFQLDPDVLKPDAPRVLLGYFQAESYFQGYRGEILDLFREPPAISDTLDRMALPFANSFFIHFRFQDFLRAYRKSHFIDLNNYYRLCLKQFPADVNLLIFSDEPVKIDDFYPGISGRGTVVECENSLASLHAMARCRLGGICANSTFSWWGAYLNPVQNKQVYMPDRFTLSKQCGPD